MQAVIMVAGAMLVNIIISLEHGILAFIEHHTQIFFVQMVKKKEWIMTIKDSGNRRKFSTGAVRDIQTGKGRCDLMPLHQVADTFKQTNGLIAMTIKDIALAQGCLEKAETLTGIDQIKQKEKAKKHLRACLLCHAAKQRQSLAKMFLEVSKHYEQGALKYGEYNWQKGIPYNSYIDSAVRHLLKYIDGQKDEPHQRAFTWNILCLLWEIDRPKGVNKEGRKKEQ